MIWGKGRKKKKDSETLLKDTAQGPTLLKKLRFNRRYKTLHIPTGLQHDNWITIERTKEHSYLRRGYEEHKDKLKESGTSSHLQRTFNTVLALAPAWHQFSHWKPKYIQLWHIVSSFQQNTTRYAKRKHSLKKTSVKAKQIWHGCNYQRGNLK